jgi:RimJ/RimL family protein N-acetyltransferase
MIRLEYFERSDFSQLKEWIKDEELLMNWSGSLFSFPLTEKSLEWYIEGVNDIKTSDALVYKVVDTERGLTVGHISLGGISKKNRSARISRVLIAENERGKGYCKLMTEAVLKIGFEDLHLHRISLGVYDFNTAAIKCYRRSGLVIEGTTRDVLRFNESWWSLVEMSMLEDEWHKRSGGQ